MSTGICVTGEHHIVLSILIIGLLNFIGFAATALTQTHKITDLIGTGSFFVSILFTLLHNRYCNNIDITVKQILIFTLVSAWSIRLALYLFIRVLSRGTDSRFDKFFLKHDETWCSAPKFFPLGLSMFWTIQFLWGVLILSPSTVSYSHMNGSIEWHDVFFIIFGWIGMLYEFTADYQKASFKNATPKDVKAFCKDGVWRYSRHPNYFGDLLLWWSVFIYCAFYIQGYEWFSIIGPLFITTLLLFVSGVNLAEKHSEETYGNDPEYIRYKAGTSILIPWFPAKDDDSTRSFY